MTWQHVAIAVLTFLTLVTTAVSGACLHLWRALLAERKKNEKLHGRLYDQAQADAAAQIADKARYRQDAELTREVLRETNVTMAAWLGEDDRR